MPEEKEEVRRLPKQSIGGCSVMCKEHDRCLSLCCTECYFFICDQCSENEKSIKHECTSDREQYTNAFADTTGRRWIQITTILAATAEVHLLIRCCSAILSDSHQDTTFDVQLKPRQCFNKCIRLIFVRHRQKISDVIIQTDRRR